MSSQSILTKTSSSLLKESDCKILKMANDFRLKRKFDLGQPCSEKIIRKEITLNRILQSENCEIKKLVKDKFIDGGVFVQNK